MNIKQPLLLVTLFACTVNLSANEQVEKLCKDNYRLVDKYQIDGNTYYWFEKSAKFLRYIPVGTDVLCAKEAPTGETTITKDERFYDYSYIGSYALMVAGVTAIIKSKK